MQKELFYQINQLKKLGISFDEATISSKEIQNKWIKYIVCNYQQHNVNKPSE